MTKPNYRIVNGNPVCNRDCNFNKKDICHHCGPGGIYRPVRWYRNDICLAGLIEQRDELRAEVNRLEKENERLKKERTETLLGVGLHNSQMSKIPFSCKHGNHPDLCEQCFNPICVDCVAENAPGVDCTIEDECGAFGPDGGPYRCREHHEATFEKEKQ